MTTHTIIYLLIISAGIGAIIAFVINSLNDYLLKKRLSVIHPDTMISIDVFKIMNPIESMKIGIYSIFFMSFISVLTFLILWMMPFFQAVAGGNVFVGAAIYSFAIYLVMMLVFLPLVHRGFFGVLYNPQTPYWSFALLVLYAILLGLLVPFVM
jgi:hypothetical protein